MNVKRLFSKDTTAESNRFRTLRMIISCVLIVVICISISVGLSYSRYTTYSEPAVVDFTGAHLYRSSNVVVAMRASGRDTVLNYNNGLVKVTIPSTATGTNINDHTPMAYALVVQNIDKTVDYATFNRQNGLSVSIALFSLYEGSNDISNAKQPVDDNSSILVEIKGDDDYINLTSSRHTVSYNSTTKMIQFETVSKIGDVGASSFSGTNFDVSWNTKSWASYADTSWYSSGATSFNISSAAQLAGLAKLVNSGNTFEGKTINLTSNIDLHSSADRIDGNGKEKRPWVPIGTTSSPFLGNFNGGSHTITGLNIHSGDSSVGLFGCIGDPDDTAKAFTIKDLTISDTDISADLDDSVDCSGALAGETYGGTIKNITVSGVRNNSRCFCGGGVIGYGQDTTLQCAVSGVTLGEFIEFSGNVVGYEDNMTINSSAPAPTTAGGATPDQVHP